MPPAKNYALTLSPRRWECKPKWRQHQNKFKLLASVAVFYRPDLTQTPQRRRERTGGRTEALAGKEPPLNGLLCVSSWCL